MSIFACVAGVALRIAPQTSRGVVLKICPSFSLMFFVRCTFLKLRLVFFVLFCFVLLCVGV